MPARSRTEYRIALPAPPPPRRTGACVGLKVRNPTLEQAEPLGALLLDAYRGTPDDEGETAADAVAEVKGYFAGKHGRAMPEASTVAWRGQEPVALCFVAWWQARDVPFIAFIGTRADSKGSGIARLLLGESLRRLSRAGHAECRAVITDGNAPSEALFKGRGFIPVADARGALKS